MTGIEGILARTSTPAVLPMGAAAPADRAIGAPAAFEMAWALWNARRAGAALPRRDALEARDLAPILGDVMILDRVRPGTIRVRLGGGTARDLMGMDVRGLPIRAFFDLDTRMEVEALVDALFETPSALEIDLHAPAQGGVAALRGKLLILPLLDGAGRATKALAVLSLDGAAVDAPRRFAMTHHVVTPIQGAAAAPARLDAAEVTRVAPPRPTATTLEGMAKAPAGFEGRPSNVPWLRVVK